MQQERGSAGDPLLQTFGPEYERKMQIQPLVQGCIERCIGSLSSLMCVTEHTHCKSDAFECKIMKKRHHQPVSGSGGS